MFLSTADCVCAEAKKKMPDTCLKSLVCIVRVLMSGASNTTKSKINKISYTLYVLEFELSICLYISSNKKMIITCDVADTFHAYE
jgi:hypothetical protein